MKEKKPLFVFWRPETSIDEKLLVVPFLINQRMEFKDELTDPVPEIYFTPAGIGISCSRLELSHCREAVLVFVAPKKGSILNEQIIFDSADFIKERPELNFSVARSPIYLINAIEQLMSDEDRMPLINECFDADFADLFFDSNLMKTRYQKSKQPLNGVFNSRSRQNIKYFRRRQ
jgi:hypothetical protein